MALNRCPSSDFAFNHLPAFKLSKLSKWHSQRRLTSHQRCTICFFVCWVILHSKQRFEGERENARRDEKKPLIHDSPKNELCATEKHEKRIIMFENLLFPVCGFSLLLIVVVVLVYFDVVRPHRDGSMHEQTMAFNTIARTKRDEVT